MPKRRRCECLHCKELFVPDLRNWWHQKYCPKPECRQASKIESQRRWLSQPQNRDVFRGSANVERVRQWRERNPGYWKRSAQTRRTLQEVLPPPVLAQAPQNREVTPQTPVPPLQTSCRPLQDFVRSPNSLQIPLLLGLISHLIDSPLQEAVEQAAWRLLQKGQDILNTKFGMETKGNTYADKETSHLPGALATGSGAVQLGGSAAGAPALRRAL